MNLRFVEWIWHIKGSLALAPGQSADAAFHRLDPLFQERGTTSERTGNTLTFTKKDQAAQDKMSIFDGGILRIDDGATGPVLRYYLASRALLFCFLAPLLFIGFGQLTVAVGKLESPAKEETAKKPEKEEAVQPQNPIDKFLGAPAPEKPKKDPADKAKKDDKKHSPTTAYVFAAIFAALYVVGRVLEDRLIRSVFRKALRPSEDSPDLVTA